MEVNLVGMTKPSAYTGCNTAQELVAWAARVSNPSNQNNLETSSKLIKYLIKHQHWSPFEMVSIEMEVKTTRDIARQLLRHRSFTFQEYSQRYADPTKDLDFVYREARLQDNKNRQNSIKTEDKRLGEEFRSMQNYVKAAAKDAYTWAIGKKIAKEQARSVLPEGMTESVLIVSGTLRSWVHYCQLRMKNGTQLEHSEIANKAWEIIQHHFPDVVQAIEDINFENDDKELCVKRWAKLMELYPNIAQEIINA